RAFEQLGVFEKPFTASSLIQQHDILPQYERLLSRFIEMLAEDGIIYQANDQWLFRQDVVRADPNAAWREFTSDAPSGLAELVMASECGDQLAAVLTGQTDPLQVFSQGPIEHLYESSPTTSFYNRVVSEVVTELVSKWPSNRILRVLEVGAGTGGMTSHV